MIGLLRRCLLTLASECLDENLHIGGWRVLNVFYRLTERAKDCCV